MACSRADRVTKSPFSSPAIVTQSSYFWSPLSAGHRPAPWTVVWPTRGLYEQAHSPPGLWGRARPGRRARSLAAGGSRQVGQREDAREAQTQYRWALGHRPAQSQRCQGRAFRPCPSRRRLLPKTCQGVGHRPALSSNSGGAGGQNTWTPLGGSLPLAPALPAPPRPTARQGPPAPPGKKPALQTEDSPP